MQENIDEVAAVAEESSASTEEVSASTEQTSASAEQIAASAHELSGNAETLNRADVAVQNHGLTHNRPRAVYSPLSRPRSVSV